MAIHCIFSNRLLLGVNQLVELTISGVSPSRITITKTHSPLAENNLEQNHLTIGIFHPHTQKWQHIISKSIAQFECLLVLLHCRVSPHGLSEISDAAEVRHRDLLQISGGP